MTAVIAGSLPFHVVSVSSAQSLQSDPIVDASEITYKTVNGDTLIGITQRFLQVGFDWRDIGAVNGIRNPGEIAAGTVLRFPAAWLKVEQISGVINSVSGPASVNGEPAQRGAKITESDRIETQADGVVVLQLPDGTQLSIAPSSQVRMDRLRGYFGGSAIDARLRLNSGALESRSPEADSNDASPGAGVSRTIRIQTPKATAAVRGTRFRVAEGLQRSASGVLTGRVSWQASAGGTDLTAGLGSSADSSGNITPPERLLHAPQLNLPAGPIKLTAVVLPFSPVNGAVNYKVRVAANRLFTNLLSEQVVTEPKVTLNTKRDGNHFISVRAISLNGIEGRDGIGELSILARPVAPRLLGPDEKSPRFDDRALLDWLDNPEVSAYRLQIASDPQFKQLVLDTRVKQSQFDYLATAHDFARAGSAQGIPTVTRFWRIAAMEGWTLGPFSDARQFSLREKAPTPVAQTIAQRVMLSWQSVTRATYIVTLEPASFSASKKRVIQTKATSLQLVDLLPGEYMATITNQFVTTMSPPGQATRFRVPFRGVDDAGNPRKVGRGAGSAYSPSK